MMELYLTFEEYGDLGGIVTDESVYNKLARKCQHLLDYITFNRIPLLPSIPECVKDTMVEFIDKTYQHDNVNSEVDGNVSSYSNTVEKIVYRKSKESELSTDLIKEVAYRYLPDYLLARGVSFDVESYLQSANNHT